MAIINLLRWDDEEEDILVCDYCHCHRFREAKVVAMLKIVEGEAKCWSCGTIIEATRERSRREGNL